MILLFDLKNPLSTPVVLLVGAGQLGSRYLQGLSAINEPLKISVVDPSENSLNLARDRFCQLDSKSAHEVSYSTSLHNVSKGQDIDLALLVTPAHCRSLLVKEIARSYKVNAWILEKVLAQNCTQLDDIQKYLSGNRNVWVNTPRRLMDWHKRIYSRISAAASFPLHVHVSGASWGLACNAIHFIDLVSWWTNASVSSVETLELENWIESKRVGFFDVLGSLTVGYSDGSTLKLSSETGNKKLKITIKTREEKWLIDESAGQFTAPGLYQEHGKIILQSLLTPQIVRSILKNGNCELPTLSESIDQHRPFLSALLKHWNSIHRCNDLVLPIT